MITRRSNPAYASPWRQRESQEVIELLQYLRSVGFRVIGAGPDGYYSVNGCGMRMDRLLDYANGIRAVAGLPSFGPHDGSGGAA